MKNLFISILILFSFTQNCYAQNTATDSLKQLLSVEKQDTSRALVLVQLSKIYLESKPDTSLLLAKQGLALSRQEKFARGQAQSLKEIGAVYGVTGNYSKGLETLLQSLKISESINDLQGVMICYVVIGANYSHQEGYKQSLSYFFKAKLIAESIQNQRYQLISLLNIGDSYEKLNQLDSASLITKEVYELSVRFDNSYIRGIALNNMGNIHAKMGKDDLAINYYRKSFPDLVSQNNDDAICEATLGMARLFKKTNQADSAIYYSRISLETAVKGGFTKHLFNASNFLSALYESIHIIDSAFAYQKISFAAKDSLFGQEKIKESQNLSFNEQIRQQEIAEAAKAAADKRKKNIQMAALGAFIPSFFGIVLIFRKRKTKPRFIDFMGMLALLMIFEFIALFLHPFIEEWTHHSPVLMLMILVAIASLLVPLHHKLDIWIKKELGIHKKHG